MLQFAVGAAAGAVVGLFHDGTPRPMALTMAGCATASLIITLAAERRNAPARATPLRVHRPRGPGRGAAPGVDQHGSVGLDLTASQGPSTHAD